MPGLPDILDAATLGSGYAQQSARLRLGALAPELAAHGLETDDLLRRLEEWDMLTLDAEGKGASTADAPFWRSEIQKARARLSRLGAGDSNPRHPGRGQNEKEPGDE